MVLHRILKLGHQFTVHFINYFFFFFKFCSLLFTHGNAEIRCLTLNSLISPQTRHGRHNHSECYTTVMVFSSPLNLLKRVLDSLHLSFCGLFVPLSLKKNNWWPHLILYRQLSAAWWYTHVLAGVINTLNVTIYHSISPTPLGWKFTIAWRQMNEEFSSSQINIFKCWGLSPSHLPQLTQASDAFLHCVFLEVYREGAMTHF